MFTLYFNEGTQLFKIIQDGHTVTEMIDGVQVCQHENKELLRFAVATFFLSTYKWTSLESVKTIFEKAASFEVSESVD